MRCSSSSPISAIVGLLSVNNEGASSQGGGADWLWVWTIITLQIAPSATSDGNSIEVENVFVMRTIPPNRGTAPDLCLLARHLSAALLTFKRPGANPETGHSFGCLMGSRRMSAARTVS